MNHSYKGFGQGAGCDIYLFLIYNGLDLVLDTFSVLNPDNYFIKAARVKINKFEINAGKIEQVSQDVYVSPFGNNDNSGLSPDDPVKNLWCANMKILTNGNPYTIHLDEGIYSPTLNDGKYSSKFIKE